MDYGIFDNMRIGVMLISPDTDEILYVNNWIKETTGDRTWEQERKKWTDLVTPEHREALILDLDIQMKKRGWFKTEFGTVVNGKSMWFDVRCSFLPERASRILCITLTDITDIKRIERDLKNITQTIPGGLVILKVDQNLTLSYANLGYYEMLGYSEAEFCEEIQNQAVRTIYPEDREALISSLYAQIRIDGRFHLDARLVKRTGEPVWMRFDGLHVEKDSLLYCVLVDISEQKDMILKLQTEQEFNQIVFSLSSDILFNLDLKSRILRHSQEVVSRFNINLQTGEFPQCTLDSNVILPKDIPVFMSMVQAMYGGRKMAAEIHMVDKIGNIGCYQIEYDFLYDGDDIPIKAIGKVKNITGQKNLERRATLDPLTHLFNKEETQKSIERCLSSSQTQEKHAFLIIDIDDFKSVNDTLGHHFGDMVLTDIAHKLKAMFHEKAVAGRIGGDEFVVFLKNIESVDRTIEKALELAEAFRHTFSGDNHNYKVSGSIGIALYPEHGASYETLYRNADRAMYESKRRGKDQYTVYSEGLMQIQSEIRKNREEPKYHRVDDSGEKLFFTAFDLLYETKDIYTSVNKILEMTGRKFDVDRCYIFEADEKGEIFNNTFEWCRDEIKPAITQLQGLHREELEYGLNQYDDDGIFICNDVKSLGEELGGMLKQQGIKSMLHCSIPGKGRMRALVGFDECRKYRAWSETEMASLSYISRLLGLYLFNRP